MKNQDNMSLQRIITMTPNEDDLEGLPDKEFKRVTISKFTQFMEDTNILQENKNIEIMNEIRMSIQNAKK